MYYLKNEISTGYAVNAAFMNYIESETVMEMHGMNLDSGN